jgi:Ser/Thr protein kinase RdoA (MazF antagonist)
MDPTFVERITKLVLSKLTEYSEYAPLSEEELKIWRDISASIEGAKIAEPVLEGYLEYLPLTQEDLKIWNDITSSMGLTKISKHSPSDGERENDQVKFYRCY